MITIGSGKRYGRGYEAPGRNLVEKHCEVDGTHVYRVHPSEIAVQPRCRACMETGRCRCRHCGRVFVVLQQQSPSRVRRPYRSVCDGCRNPQALRERRRGGTTPGPFVLLTCRGATAFGSTRHHERCVRRRSYLESVARRLATFDPVALTWICEHCRGLEKVARIARHILAGTINVTNVVAWDRLSDIVSEECPDGRLHSWEQAFRLTSALGKAHDAWGSVRVPGGGNPTRGWGLKVTVARWRKGVTTLECRQCRAPGCHKLLVATVGSGRPGSHFHRPCWLRLVRDTTSEVHKWQARTQAMRRAGATQKQIAYRHGASPPRPPGKLSDPRVLTRDFGWAVASLLKKISHEELAREARLTRPRVSLAIKRVVELLPDPGLVTKDSRQLITELRRAAATKRG